MEVSHVVLSMLQSISLCVANISATKAAEEDLPIAGAATRKVKINVGA